MAKLRMVTLDGGSRVVVSLTTSYDPEARTRFDVPRPSSRPPPLPSASSFHVPRAPRVPSL